MDREYIQRLAAGGLCMPVGMDLVLHMEPDPAAVVLDGAALGRLLARAAHRFHTPFAIPLMDLQLEKAFLLRGLGLTPEQAATFHFTQPPTEAQMADIRQHLHDPLPARLQAQVEAIAAVAADEPDLVPCAMTIGPFSLLTKLLDDPISLIYQAGAGLTAEEDEGVCRLERCMELAMLAVETSLRAQLAAGAAMAFVAEPAANRVYVSPKQMARGSDVFDRLVMANLRRYAGVLREYEATLWFHNCGELTDAMIRSFCSLQPAVLSLGSSRPLWEVAPLVPSGTVLYGNLPSKQFSSDAAITVEQVRAAARDLVQHMRALGRPFILGTECDVLHVPEAVHTIWAKVDAFMRVGAAAQSPEPQHAGWQALPERTTGRQPAPLEAGRGRAQADRRDGDRTEGEALA